MNKGQGRGLSAEVMTQLNSAVDCGLIQEKLRALDAIVFSFIAFIWLSFWKIITKLRKIVK